MDRVIAKVGTFAFRPPQGANLREFFVLSFNILAEVANKHFPYIDKLIFVSIAQQFAICRIDQEVSLFALRLYQIVLSDISEIECTEERTIDLWFNALVRLKQLCSHVNEEIRKEAFKTLEKIFFHNVSFVPLSIWNYFFFYVMNEVMSLSEEIFISYKTSSMLPKVSEIDFNNALTPSFNANCKREAKHEIKKMTFDEESIKNSNIDYDKDEAEERWEKTIILTFQTIGSIFYIFQKSRVETVSKKLINEKIINFLLDSSMKLIKVATSPLIVEILRLFARIDWSVYDESFSNIEIVLNIFEKLMIWISSQYGTENEPSYQIDSNISSLIIITLRSIFNNQRSEKKKVFINLKTIKNIIDLTKKVC